MFDTLFICKANVQRSQAAQWLYNHYSKYSKSISCAWVEARKIKYKWKPEKNITEILLNRWVDIREQNINYITDFQWDDFNNIKRVIFLYNPTNENIIDNECLVEGVSVYNYFNKNNNIEIVIHEIKDPYKLWLDETIKIYKELEKFIKNLI
jgi:protein-tyrosine-phosphatase